MTAAALARLTRSLVAVAFKPREGHGSGFVVSHGNDYTLVLTAEHVIGRRKRGALTRRYGRKFIGHRFELERRDADSDLALLRTERLRVPVVTLASELPHLYDRVYVIGCPVKTEHVGPEAYFGSVVECRLSAMDGSNGDDELDYQLSAPIGGGMSGGMVLNEAGQLVGVATSGDDGAFVSFATSLPLVREFLSCRT